MVFYAIMKDSMQMLKTNINNFGVQLIGLLTIVAVATMNAYPLPALAFAKQIAPHSLYFPHNNVVGVTATAYSSTPDQTDSSPFITASGSRVHHGTVAANFLPLGTIIRINDEEFEIDDRMSPRYNDTYHIDIWTASREAAQSFGTQAILIEIVALP